MAKRYYWLKLDKNFFKRHDIRIIETMENGKDYILFYLKLLVESVSHNGELRFSETIPYNEQMLSVVTNTNIDIVRAAMQVFRELGMMEVLNDETLFMTEVQKMVGSESESAERVRRCREKKSLSLQCNANVTNCNVEKEIDKDKEKEKEYARARVYDPDLPFSPQTRSRNKMKNPTKLSDLIPNDSED